MANTGKLWFDLDVRNRMLGALKENQNAAKNLEKSLKVTGSMGDRIIQRLNMLRETKNSLDKTISKATTLNVDTSRLEAARGHIMRMMADLQRLAENAGSGNISNSMVRSLLGADVATQVKTVKEQIKGVTEEIKSAEKEAKNSNFFSVKNWRSLASAIYSVRQITRTIGDIFSTMFGPTVGFEKQLSNLAAILQTNIDGVKGLEDQALNLGRTTNYTASQVVELQTELSKLGYSEEQVRAATPGVLEFAQACGTDLASAATTAGSAIRAFGADAAETKDYVATMAIATTHSALQFSDFQTIIGTVFPVAHQFNLSIQDTVALMMKLKDAGMDTSTAATSLRNIFLNLSNSDSKLSKLVGMDVHDMDTFVQAMQKMRDAAKTMGTEFLGISGTAAGKRGVTAFNVIAEQAKDLYRVRDSITDVGDELDDMASTQTRNAASAILRVKSAWEGWMLSIRESDGWMMNFLDNLANRMNEIHDFFSSSTVIDDSFSTEITNSTLQTESYIRTLQDASSTEEQKQKAAKKLADQLVENGICTSELIDKMKDQYNYYDFLIEKEGELTSALRMQAAERVAIREQENAQAAFNSDVTKYAREATDTWMKTYKGATDNELTKSQQLDLEKFIMESYQRMAKEREEWLKGGNRTDKDIEAYAEAQKKAQRKAEQEYIQSLTHTTFDPNRSSGTAAAFINGNITDALGAIEEFNTKCLQIEASVEGFRNAWGDKGIKDNIKDQIDTVGSLEKKLEEAKKKLDDLKSGGGTEQGIKWQTNVVEGLDAQLKDAQKILDDRELEIRAKITTQTEQIADELLATEAEIDKYKQRMAEKGVPIPIQVKNYAEAIQKLKLAKAEADRTGTTVPIDIIVEAANALQALNKVKSTAAGVGGTAMIHIGVDDTAIAEAAKNINNWLTQLSNTKIGIGDAPITFPFKPEVTPTGSILKVENKNLDYTPTRPPKQDKNTSKAQKEQRDAEAAAEKARNERIAKSNKEAARVLKVYQDEQKLLKETKEAALKKRKAEIDAMPDGVKKDIAMKGYEEDKATWELWLDKEKAIYDQIMKEWDAWLEKTGGEKAGKADAKEFIKFFKSDAKNLSDQADAVAKLDTQVVANLNTAMETQSLINKTRSAAIVKKYWDKLDKELKGATPEFQIEVNEKTREEWLKQVEELAESDEQKKKYQDLVNKFFNDKNIEIRLNEFKKAINWEELFGDINNLSFSALDMLEKQLESIIKTNKELDPQKMKEFVTQLNKIKEQKAILNPTGGLFGSYKDYRDKRQKANDISAELGKSKDYQDYLSALANGASNIKELGDVMITLDGKTVKCSEAMDKLTQAQKDATDAQNNAKANGKKIFGQENWITDMMEGKQDDQSWQNFYSKILDGIAMNMESAGKLLDTIGLGDSGVGKAVKKISGFSTGMSNAMKSFMNGDIFGAMNNIVEGFLNLKDIFGEHGWAKQAEHLALSNEHLQKAIDNLADVMAKAYYEEKKETFDKILQAYREMIEGQRKLLEGNAKDSTAGFLGIKSQGSANHYINQEMTAADWARISKITGANVTNAADLWNLTPEQWRDIQSQAWDVYTRIIEASEEGKTSIKDELEAYIDMADKVAETLQEKIQELTGTSFDSLLQTFASGLDSMNDMSKDFGDNFTKILRNAVINAFVNGSVYRKAVEALYQKMGDYAENNEYGENGEIYSAREIADMRADANDILEKQKVLQDSLKAMGLYNDQVSGMTGAIQGVTEETADLLASYINAIRADVSVNRENITIIANYVPIMSNSLAEGLSSLKSIEANTGRNADAAEEMYSILNAVTTTTGQGKALRVS